jgi:hypothetical protein
MLPFFKFNGSRFNIAGYYPKPEGVVCEPFAGSASYSVKNNVKISVLVDSDKYICDIWEYLINVSEPDFLNLPSLQCGQDLDKLDISDGAKKYLSYWAGNGERSNIVCSRCQWNDQRKKEIAVQLSNIRNWVVINGDWSDSPNSDTTFIDPPSKVKDKNSDIDYHSLSKWVRRRGGLVILTEYFGSRWFMWNGIYKDNVLYVNRKKRKITFRLKCSSGDFLLSEKENGDKRIIMVASVADNYYIMATEDDEIIRWPKDGNYKGEVIVAKLSKNPEYKLIKTTYNKISKEKCDTCNVGVDTSDKVISEFNRLYKIVLGDKNIHLCSSCFNRLKMSMMIPCVCDVDEMNKVILDSFISKSSNFDGYSEMLSKVDYSPHDVKQFASDLLKKEVDGRDEEC